MNGSEKYLNQKKNCLTEKAHNLFLQTVKRLLLVILRHHFKIVITFCIIQYLQYKASTTFRNVFMTFFIQMCRGICDIILAVLKYVFTKWSLSINSRSTPGAVEIGYYNFLTSNRSITAWHLHPRGTHGSSLKKSNAVSPSHTALPTSL